MRRHRDHGEDGGEHQIGVAPAQLGSSAAVIGANTVLASPPAKVSTVSALTR